MILVKTAISIGMPKVRNWVRAWEVVSSTRNSAPESAIARIR